MVVLGGCAQDSVETSAPCPPATRPPVGPEAIDRVMDQAIADVVNRRAVPDPEARRQARRAIVTSCLQTVASSEPVRLAIGEAARKVVEACDAVIDRYNLAEATDAAFRGADPPSPGALGGNRIAFEAQAADILRDMRAGRCP